QEQRGSIDGIVKDASGLALPGATVEAKNTATGATLATLSDATGKFRFPSVQIGIYEVKASLAGFRPVTIPDILVALGQLVTIDGSSSAENRYVVDGMETTDVIKGQSGKDVLADFVEEVQVKSSGYSAEYGGSTGAVINVITKSGTNQFQGSALAYWQGDRV